MGWAGCDTTTTTFGVRYETESDIDLPLRRNMGRFNPTWAVVLPSLSHPIIQDVLVTLSQSVKDVMTTLIPIFMSNEWEINLLKNALCLFCARFVVLTYSDYFKQKAFEKKFTRKRGFDFSRVPRLTLATSMVIGTILWLDSIFVFPQYVINIGKNSFFLVLGVKTIPPILSAIGSGLTKIGRALSAPFRRPKKSSIPKKTSPPLPPKIEKVVPVIEPPVVSIEEKVVVVEEETKKETVVEVEKEEMEKETVEVKKEKTVAKKEKTVAKKEKIVVKKEKVETDKETVPKRVIRGILGSVALVGDIQESLAEFQTKTFPSWFDGLESYETNQERLNSINKQILEMFKKKEESDEESS